jgi:hypothetical protein
LNTVGLFILDRGQALEQRRTAEATAANEAYILRQQVEGRIAALEEAKREMNANVAELARTAAEAIENKAGVSPCSKAPSSQKPLISSRIF